MSAVDATDYGYDYDLLVIVNDQVTDDCPGPLSWQSWIQAHTPSLHGSRVGGEGRTAQAELDLAVYVLVRRPPKRF